MSAPGFGLRAARLLALWQRFGADNARSSAVGQELLRETADFIDEANERPSCRALPLVKDDR